MVLAKGKNYKGQSSGRGLPCKCHLECHILCVDAPILALRENFSIKVQVTGGQDGKFNLLGLFVFLPAFHRSVCLPCTWLCVSDPVCPVFVCLPLLLMVSRCFHSSPFRMTQILCLSHVQGVGLPAVTAQRLDAEDMTSCFADSVCIV